MNSMGQLLKHEKLLFCRVQSVLTFAQGNEFVHKPIQISFLVIFFLRFLLSVPCVSFIAHSSEIFIAIYK